ncbi:MAG TPA: hypothetical protein DDY49_06780 [Paenibacillaceae bacterium]|nr:hypothetical protein [Paenibacillaceae bacterium]
MGIHSNSPYSSTFEFNNKILQYFRTPENNVAERTIEVPIGLQFLQENQSKRILEVGNVLSQYEESIVKRDILDKFEVGEGIMNVDVMDFNPDEKYDSIISISTIEHIGQGMDPFNIYGEESNQSRDLELPLKGLMKIFHLLKENGNGLITVPFGKLKDEHWLVQFSSDYLDLLVTKYGLPKHALSTVYFRKIDMETTPLNPSQIWEQCEQDDLKNSDFNSPFPFANGIAVIQLEKKPPEPLKYDSRLLIGNLYFNYPPFVFVEMFDFDGWIACKQSGYLFYGPYINYNAGRYLFTCHIETKGDAEYLLNISSNKGENILSYKKFIHSIKIEEIIHFTTPQENVEVRLYVHEPNPNASFRIPHLSLRKVEED